MVNYLMIGNYARTNFIHHRLRSLFPIDTYQFLIGAKQRVFQRFRTICRQYPLTVEEVEAWGNSMEYIENLVLDRLNLTKKQ